MFSEIRFDKAARFFPLMLILVAAGLGVKAEGRESSASNTLVRLNTCSEHAATLKFSLGELRHDRVNVEGMSFDRLWIEGEESTFQAGEPDLPTVARFMLIPPDCGVDLQVSEYQTRLMKGIHPLPTPPDSYTNLVASLKSDLSERTGVDGFWPPESAKLGRPAILRGYRILPLLIYPLRYNPQTGEIQVIESLSLNLDFTSDLNRVNLVENPERLRASRFADDLVRDLALNPPPRRDDPPVGGSILYVTGNWNDVVNELTPLMEWRRRMGWTVNIVRIAAPDAVSNKNAILQAYRGDNPPEHVVIVGDTDGNYPRGFFDMRRGGNWPYESDHLFVELEGDDPLPECAVGRLVFDNTNRLRGIVQKIIAYESDPYIGEGEDFGWQKRALLVAGDGRSGLSSIDVCRWTGDLALRQGFNRINEMYWTQQNPQPDARQFIIQGINAGASLFLYRGWNNMSGFGFEDVDGLRNRQMLPFVMLATCNTGDYGEHAATDYYYSERFCYLANGGSIGAVGTSGATHTAYNNLIASSTIKAFLADGIWSQGWSLMKGKVDLYRHYFDRGDVNHQENPGLQAWLCELYIYNLMGDPAVDLFTDIPTELEVVRPEFIHTGETVFEAVVNRAEDGEPVAEALVCLYKSGVFQLVQRTDAEGRIVFNLAPDWTQDGEIKFTVTGHNLRSFLADYEIQQAERFLGCGLIVLDDDAEGESEGNDDGTANPAETLECTLQVTNYGEDLPEGNLSLTLTPALPQLEALQAEDAFDAAPQAGESVNARFLVRIGGGFHNGETAAFHLTATVNEESWTSAVTFPVAASDLVVQAVEWMEGLPRAGEIKPLRITLKNIGDRRSPLFTATLALMVPTVGAPQPQGVFPALDPDAEAASEAVFRLAPNALYLGEKPVEVAVALESEEGQLDTAWFSFEVLLDQEDRPFGPDDYGYLCFDDTDQDWAVAPVFDWIEINPAIEGRDADGVNTNLSDTGEEHDASVVVDLPFVFTYYGEEFDRITVCTNGWAALGDHSGLITSRNRRIPGGEVGSAMLCPFWEDLITIRNGGIFTWYNQDEEIFVIEWSQMRKLGPRGANEPLETFEIVLFDPEVYPTFTGDGNILFQYSQVTDDQSCFQEWDTPFATTGIGSVDQATGLEYSYWGAHHPAAAPLAQGRAILFTTMIEFEIGALEGQVIDALTNQPVEGATITTTFGFTAATDAEGYYLISPILVDTSITYDVTASKVFFNDSTVSGVEIRPGETTRVDFGLLMPVFDLGVEEVEVFLEPQNANEITVPLRNAGSGPLTFSSKIEFGRLNRDDPYEPFLWFNFSDAAVGLTEEGDTVRLGNSKINGICFVDSIFYVCAGGSDRNNQWPEVYRFTREGVFIDSLRQPWLDNNGVRGLAWDGANLWGAYNHYLYKLDPHNIAVLDSFIVPPSRPLDVAFDPATGTLYTMDTTLPITAFDTLGNAILDSLGEPRSWNPTWQGSTLRKYGLAWHPGQTDGYNLLIFANVGNQPSLFGLNPVDGELVHLADFGDSTADQPRGMDITGHWNTSVWTLALSFSNDEADWASVYELEPNADWFSYSPVEGVVEAGEELSLRLRIESGQKPIDRYWLDLVFHHSAEPGLLDVPVIMHVVAHSATPDQVKSPGSFGLEPNFPNPFNAATTLRFMLIEAGKTKLSVFDLTGRLVGEIQNGWLPAGHHKALLDGSDLATGVYLVRLESGGLQSTRKVVQVK